LVAELSEGRFGALGLDDEMLEAMREQFLRFGAAEITPFAPEWHAKNELIPIELVGKLAEMGVFGLTVPEEFGGWASARWRCAWCRRR
jgi:(2S)-methylsuccinyl-CoA dehydrogenase